MSLTLTSPQVQPGDPIPAKHACEGEDVSPGIQWSDPPAGTVSFALIMDDPDAPLGTFTHWLIWNIPADRSELPEAVVGKKLLADLGSALQGHNDFGRRGYSGPCPPQDKTHRYFFRLFALDRMLVLDPGVRRMQLEAAMRGHVLGQVELMGSYRRASKP